ncbi:MAG: sporulation protein YqfD [bacterium]|nr:sporulation protein YqfD [bacterium]
MKGYVIIELYGRGAERFLNICTRRGIDVRNIEHHADGLVRVRISRRDFKLLRPIAYKTRTKVHIVKKRGLFELKRRFGKRYGLIAGAAVLLIFMAAAPKFVWTVSITGNETVPREDIESALIEAGIYPGALKKNIPDGFEVKDIILRRNPRLMWAWAYISGTSVDVVVGENELPPVVVDRDEPCSIAASCDAYLKTVRALNGEKLIDGGSVVRAGEVIVSGRIPVFKEGEPERYKYVHARAETEAYTERRESAVYKLEYEHRMSTGKSENKPYIELFGKRLNLYKREESSYESYDTSEFRHEILWFALGGTTYTEVIVETEPMSLEGALQEAKEDLEKKTAGKLCRNAVLLNEDLQYEYVSENEIKVQLTMSCIEDIGAEIPIKEQVKTEETDIDSQKD